jgi:small subunit ribosomal protein S4e
LHRISADEARFKLLRVIRIAKGKKASQGRNPFHTGHLGTVPYVVTHDGRTIRYPDPVIKVNDVVKFDLKEGKIVDVCKFEIGSLATVTRGHNTGRVGVVTGIDKHPGSFDIVHLKDKRGNAFATRSANVFIVGDHSKPWISLPRGKGIKLSILEEQARDFSASGKSQKKKVAE